MRCETIFAGIGIAVISTLLGIVVSIVLEFFEVFTHSSNRYWRVPRSG